MNVILALGIFEWLESCWNAFVGLLKLAIHLIADIVYLTTVLDSVRDVLNSMLDYMPAVISGTLGLIIVIAVLYKVLGREG